MQRRDLFKGLAAGAALAASSGAAACVRRPPAKDTLGERLVAFLRDGDEALLEDLLHEDATLVTFAPGWLPDDGLAVGSAPAVAAALKDLQKSLTGEGIEGPRKMITGTISGPDELGAVRRIDLVFAEDKTTLTSCGPTRSETSLQILYKTHYTVLSVRDHLWGMDRIAIMPLV
jgi:hypothetical protein